MRAIGLMLAAAITAAGCSTSVQPPTSADTQFSVVIYNRTQAPVFVLAHEVGACASSRMPFAETLVEGETTPPGVRTAHAVTITTPRGYTGTVSVVITAGGSSSVTVGDIPDSSLPACQGTACDGGLDDVPGLLADAVLPPLDLDAARDEPCHTGMCHSRGGT